MPDVPISRDENFTLFMNSSEDRQFEKPNGFHLIVGMATSPVGDGRSAEKRRAFKIRAEVPSMAGAVLAGLTLCQSFFRLRSATVQTNMFHEKFRA